MVRVISVRIRTDLSPAPLNPVSTFFLLLLLLFRATHHLERKQSYPNFEIEIIKGACEDSKTRWMVVVVRLVVTKLRIVWGWTVEFSRTTCIMHPRTHSGNGAEERVDTT